VDYEEVNTQLADKYLEVLKSSSIQSIFEVDKSLSGVFLPKASRGYCASNRKIMIIGKETKVIPPKTSGAQK